jgi:phosphonoacetate hydrolase
MFDGICNQLHNSTELPNLNKMQKEGFYKEVKAIMPTVTNANNASICCGVFPEIHGVTGNSYLTPQGTEAYMESSDLVLAPTLFERAKHAGYKSALLSSKKKSIALLSKGTELAISPETADETWKQLIGTPPPIYSREVNYWLMDAALYVLKNRKDITCLYIHTTDYPMHTWAPEEAESKEHLKKIDEYIGKIMQEDPDAMILITADHDVNHKSGCWDLEKACAQRKTLVRIAISAEKDKYPKHHKGYGGVSYVYLLNPKDEAKVTQTLMSLPGVKNVYRRDEAAARFHLLKERIGDLMVLADSNTVFGNIETQEFESLPATYRSHGSEFEQSIPLFIYNAETLPPATYFQYNKDLAAWLYK